MAEGLLGGHKSTTAGTYNVYEVPSGKTAEVNISLFSDTTSTAVVKLFIKPAIGTSPTAIHTIQYEKFNVNRNRFERPAIILQAGETVSYYTDSSDVSVVVSGIEYPTSGIDISSRILVSTNTETVLYTVPASKTVTINTTASLVVTTNTESCTTKLYVSNTDAANGFVLQKDELFATGQSGFERTGFVLTSGQKLILVTTGLSGSVACRVHGKLRGSN